MFYFMKTITKVLSLILALIAGIPLGDIANVIGAGFSGTFSSI